MDTLKDPILEFHSNTLEFVRKEVNLDSPSRLNQAIELLDEWLKKQNHFIKRNFPRKYLEITLILAKGSVERAKERLDKQFTYKTLMPELYPSLLTKEYFAPLNKIASRAHLPKMTKDHYRVFLNKLLVDDLTHLDISMYYKYVVIICEYLKMHDYNNGIIFILDIRNVNIFNLITKLNPLLFKNFVQLSLEGYGFRVKRLDIISDSKAVESLVALFKQVLNAKLGNRIQTHKNLDTIYEVVGKDIMPEDYGGKELPLKQLTEKWIDVLFSKENIEYLHEMKDAKTDESCRQVDTFNEHYVGIAGSFRTLTVD